MKNILAQKNKYFHKMSSSMNIIVVDDDNADAEVYILAKGLIQDMGENYFCVLHSLGPIGRNSLTNKTLKNSI